MKDAIELAIKGGYEIDTTHYWVWLGEDSAKEKETQIYDIKGTDAASIYEIFSDPLFWQSLGKSLGWNDLSNNWTKQGMSEKSDWITYWHRFIDHLIEGKDPSEFFTSLIK